MSRPLRIEFGGAWYHVMNRGRAREAIFADETDYQVILDTVREATERFDCQYLTPDLVIPPDPLGTTCGVQKVDSASMLCYAS